MSVVKGKLCARMLFRGRADAARSPVMSGMARSDRGALACRAGEQGVSRDSLPLRKQLLSGGANLSHLY
jgi:hypothetical protein